MTLDEGPTASGWSLKVDTMDEQDSETIDTRREPVGDYMTYILTAARKYCEQREVTKEIAMHVMGTAL